MAIGRSFQEALQKACQSLEISRHGLGADGKVSRNLEELIHGLEYASWNRIFQVKDALALGVPISSVQKITKIDRWFLEQINDLVKKYSEYVSVCFDKELKRYGEKVIDVQKKDVSLRAIEEVMGIGEGINMGI